MNKTKLVALKLILIFFVLIGCQKSETVMVNLNDFRRFGLTFQKYYRRHVKRNIKSEKYLKHFDLYNNKGLIFNCTLSKLNGASIELIPSHNTKFNFSITNDSIEDYIFKDINLKAYDIPPQTINHLAFVNKQGLKGAFFTFDGHVNFNWHGSEIITNDAKFIRITSDEVNLLFKDILVDKVRFPNYLLIKGGNKRHYWNKNEAKNFAKSIFDFELGMAYFDSEEFRKFLSTPILRDLANKIVARNQDGTYVNHPEGALKYEEDLMKLKQIAIENDFPVEFTEIVLRAQKEHYQRKMWLDKHPWLALIIAGIVSLVIWLLYENKLEIISKIKSLFNIQ